ncbi:hypothetical protein RF679_05990 [Undibacterium cyanobacteriorum]|uniref:Uncharacterized protein n=1 Tax=Undibacterium cyanobacteriorum TaxID=3073561 RepID=A0ABY9RKT1_9BURK|nr:hypothetical protein [Undibacterium sp. 20NA77.5]WMW81831.1 hypothetical protein RF679_05990 [Undibacterium sp. 20NA77.5]
MTYNVQILSHTIPEDDESAFKFMEAQLDEYFGNNLPVVGVMKSFYDRVVQYFPCFSSFPDNDPRFEQSPWADAPLINNFSPKMAVVAIRHSDVDRVLPKLIELAHHLNLTIFDEQTALVHRPAETYMMILRGVQAGFDVQDIASKLAPTFKSDVERMMAILTGPAISIKKGLSFAMAQSTAEKLEKLGCIIEIRGAESPEPPASQTPSTPTITPAISRASELSLTPKEGEQSPAQSTPSLAPMHDPSKARQEQALIIGPFDLMIPHAWTYSYESEVHDLMHPETGTLLIITEMDAGRVNPRLSLEMQLAQMEDQDPSSQKTRDIYQFQIPTEQAPIIGFGAEYLQRNPGKIDQRFLISHLVLEQTCIAVVCILPDEEFTGREAKYRNLFATLLRRSSQIQLKQEPKDIPVAKKTPRDTQREFAESDTHTEHDGLSAQDETRIVNLVNAKQRLWLALAAIVFSFFLLITTKNQEVFILSIVGVGIGISAVLKIFDGKHDESNNKILFCVLMCIPIVNLITILYLQKLASDFLQNS